MKALRILLVILFLLAVGLFCLSSCRTKETFYKETYRDTTFKFDGGVVSAGLDSADLSEMLAALKRGRDTIIYRDRNGNAALKFYLDKEGKLKADCEAQAKEYHALIKQLAEKSIVQVPFIPPWIKWLIIGLVGLIVVLVLLVAIMLIFR